MHPGTDPGNDWKLNGRTEGWIGVCVARYGRKTSTSSLFSKKDAGTVPLLLPIGNASGGTVVGFGKPTAFTACLGGGHRDMGRYWMWFESTTPRDIFQEMAR